MEKAALIMKAIQTAGAIAQALVAARETYEVLIAEAERNKELTSGEAANLRAEAALIFASPASQPSGR